jgi:hypothetical protein
MPEAGRLGQPNREYRDRLRVNSVMSSCLLWRSQIALLPTDSIGLHRVGAYLRLMNKAAPGAPQGPVLESDTGRGNVLNLCAGLAFGTTRPRRRAR